MNFDLNMVVIEWNPIYYNEYREWFVDSELNKYLGPKVDDIWLSSICSDEKVKCYIALLNGNMVALVEIIDQSEWGKPFLIGAIAVNHKMRRMGIARRMIEWSISKYKSNLMAIISCGNDSAKILFIKCGFVKTITEANDADEIYIFNK